MRAHDWSTSPLGDPASWPQSLRTSVSTCLNCSFPILIWWGRDLIKLYNDAYRPILGGKHPAALGRPGQEVWPEIWHIVGPMLGRVLDQGEATPAEDLRLMLYRQNYVEECYFSFSYSPIHDESGGVGGVFCPVIETTERVIGRRRLQTVSALGVLPRAPDPAAAAADCARVLAANASDLPFALLYLIEHGRDEARLAGAAGIAPGGAPSPWTVALNGAEPAWPMADLPENGIEMTDLAARFGDLPCGEWDVPPEQAAIIPIAVPGAGGRRAVMVVALSPHKRLDAAYRDFLKLVADLIGNRIADAAAVADERKRAEALADIDRAKTEFFSNISHEFRTPLTLMLNPVEEARARTPADDPRHEMLAVAHRNALRMQRLVNSLLDFARVEAGRLQARFEPFDLAAFTRELAANFTSAIEQAGLALVIEAPKLPEPVFVDPQMWETIVLNLISNAFKFTFEGRIEVRLGTGAEGRSAVLTVADTGTGIPAGELPHLFKRFHQVAGARGRSIEGSGIGLALVQELVRLHGGTIDVSSVPDQGSAFTVTVPFGRAHLPAASVRDAAISLRSGAASSFLSEARRWLKNDDQAGSTDRPPAAPARNGGRVLVADDNADIRDYLVRLLAAAGFEVQAVADGAAALERVRASMPDVVLADVMMPKLDGFGLLAALRADPATRYLPILLLSARAGEEARVDALQAGADDYLVKPFSARSLVVSVEGHWRLAGLRRAAEQRTAEQKRILEMVATGAPLEATLNEIALFVERQEAEATAVIVVAGPDGQHVQRSYGSSLPEEFHRSLAGLPLGLPYIASWAEAMTTASPVMVPDMSSGDAYAPAWRHILSAHGLVAVRSTPILRQDGEVVACLALYYRRVLDPMPADPTLIGIGTHLAAIALDRAHDREVTAAREERLRESEAQLREFVERAPAALAMFDTDMRYLAVSDRYMSDYGLGESAPSELIGRNHYEVFPEIPQRWRRLHRRVLAGEAVTADEDVFERKDGRKDQLRWEMLPWRRPDGRIGGVLLAAEIITARKEAERRNLFLLDLADRIRAAPREAMTAATELVGTTLGVSSVGYIEVDESGEYFTIGEEFSDGTIPSAVGTHRLLDFGADIVDDLRGGRTLVIGDVAADLRARSSLAAYQKIGTQSVIAVPLVRDGRLRATLYLNHREPRAWTQSEITLLEEVANRTWAAVEQARAEAALERAADEFRMLADNISQFAWMTRPDGWIFWLNRRWFDYTGTTLDQMQGWGWQRVLHPDHADRVIANLRAHIAAGEPWEDTFPLRAADGRYRWFLSRALPIIDGAGRVQRWFGTNTDVTERIEAERRVADREKSLADSEERLRLAVEAGRLGTFDWDILANELVWDYGVREIWAVPRDEEVTIDTFYAGLHPDDVERVGAAMAASHDVRGDGEFNVEYRVIGRADGAQRCVSARGRTIFHESRAIRMIGITVDVTELREAEAVLSRDKIELEQLVAERTRDLQESQHRLAHLQRMEALGQLAGGIAHDFNNVLQAVQGGAGLIERRPADADGVRRLARMIFDAATRGSSITRRLLAFSRRGDLRAEAVDPVGLLGEMREILVHTLGAGIGVRVQAPMSLPPMLADKGQLETMLVNLATNARDAMSGNGVLTFEAALDSAEQDGPRPARALKPGAYIRLSVTDTGTGMPPEILAKVTEPFFTTKPQGVGTGLGLAMARGFIEQSGGALLIESAVNKGTTVNLWLPVAESAALTAREEKVPLPPGSTARLLVVDDESLVREIITEQLKSAGYTVMAVGSAQEALALLDAREPIDLIISDLSMPGMDGVALIREVNRRRPLLPAILLTGFATNAAEIAVGGAISGMFSLLRKPITEQELTERVAMLLEGSTVRADRR